MPNGFNNPYIDEYFGTYTSGEGSSVGQTLWESMGSPGQSYEEYLSSLETSLNQFLQTEASQYAHYGESPYYSYQGISPDIMQTLTGVFGEHSPTFSAEDAWGTEGNDALAEWLEAEMGLVSPYTEIVGDSGEFDLSSPLAGVNIFDPESIANVLSEIGGIEESPIKASEIQALTPEMLEKTESQYYDPYEASERGTLVDKLGKDIAKVGTGGFAGSGTRQSDLSSAERMYSSGYADILADIMKFKGSATGDVMDVIYGWQELLSDQTTTS